MLILTRKTDQDILIPDLNITIRVLEIRSHRVRLGIEAPQSVKILRSELQTDPSVECGRSSIGCVRSHTSEVSKEARQDPSIRA